MTEQPRKAGERQSIARLFIANMPKEQKFCGYEIAIQLSLQETGTRDKKIESQWRVFLSGFMPKLIKEKKVKFVGEEPSAAPMPMKIYKKI